MYMLTSEGRPLTPQLLTCCNDAALAEGARNSENTAQNKPARDERSQAARGWTGRIRRSTRARGIPSGIHAARPQKERRATRVGDAPSLLRRRTDDAQSSRLLAVAGIPDVLQNRVVDRGGGVARDDGAFVEGAPRDVAVVTTDAEHDAAHVADGFGHPALESGHERVGRRAIGHTERPLGGRGLQNAERVLHLQRRIHRVWRMVIAQRAPARIALLRTTGPNAGLEVSHEPRAAAGAVAPERIAEEQGVHIGVLRRIGRDVAEVPAAAAADVSAVGQLVDTFRRAALGHVLAHCGQAVAFVSGHVERVNLVTADHEHAFGRARLVVVLATRGTTGGVALLGDREVVAVAGLVIQERERADRRAAEGVLGRGVRKAVGGLPDVFGHAARTRVLGGAVVAHLIQEPGVRAVDAPNRAVRSGTGGGAGRVDI